jgi:hypothetical protein
MQSQPVTQEDGKRRSRRSSDVLQDFLKALDSEHSDLLAQRDYIQAKLDLVERQKSNLQEVIDIDQKLADMDRRSSGKAATSSEGSE